MAEETPSHLPQRPILPPDILSYIFKLATPPPVTFCAPLDDKAFDSKTQKCTSLITCATVSSYWRHVIYSTPSLWTSLTLNSVSPANGERCALTLAHYFRSSGDLPMHLALSFPDFSTHRDNWDDFSNWESRRRSWTALEPYEVSFLRVDLGRIHTLLLKNPPSSWLSCLPKMSALTNLRIRHSSAPSLPKEIELNKCRALRRLSVHAIDSPSNPRTRNLQRLPSFITVLDLSHIPIDTCIKLLLRAPNLTELYLDSPSSARKELDSADAELWLAHPVVLGHLHTLHWDSGADGSGCGWGYEFLQRANTPVLHTLQIKNDPRNCLAQRSFFGRLPQSLTKVKIRDAKIFFDSNLFGNSTSQEIALDGCDELFLMCLLAHLGTDEEGRRMPMLQTMSIRHFAKPSGYKDYRYELSSSGLKILVLFLEQRLKETASSFRIEFCSINVDWPPSVEDTLRKLVKRGARLEIIQDSEAVDWLEEPS